MDYLAVRQNVGVKGINKKAGNTRPHTEESFAAQVNEGTQNNGEDNHLQFSIEEKGLAVVIHKQHVARDIVPKRFDEFR